MRKRLMRKAKGTEGSSGDRKDEERVTGGRWEVAGEGRVKKK